jgi:hypothetical protein
MPKTAAAPIATSPIIDLPLYESGIVHHVGSLDPSEKGSGSYEGYCLSVSEDPDAWIRIARLGGRETWSSQKGGAFLDILALEDGQREAIVDWAVAEGILERIVTYGFSWFDEEDESDRYCVFSTEEERDGEMEFEEPYEAAGWRMLPEALLRHGQTREAVGDFAFDLAVVDYVSATTELDGVWWHERLDPESLSAPRGAVLPERMEKLGFVVAAPSPAL